MTGPLVSLRRLLHEPAAFDTRRVATVGFLDVESELPALYASGDAYRSAQRGEAIVLRGIARRRELQGKVVLVEGFFGQEQAGSASRGNLGDVLRVGPWMPATKDASPLAPVPPLGADTVARVLERPDIFTKERIRVSGFAVFKRENRAIYVSEEAYRCGMTKDAVWLSVKRVPMFLDKRYVVVEGEFDGSTQGHRSMFSGTLGDVTRMEALGWAERAMLQPRGSTVH